MGFFDIVAAALPWSESEAEAVRGGASTVSTPANSGDKGEGEAKDPSGPTPDDNEGGDEGGDEGEEKEEGGEDGGEDGSEDGGDEEEEEEEEELVDPKETFEEECKESKACAPVKHHFEECVERVTGNTNSKAPHEDCVEEFFHLAHCANQCAAPKLWAALK